MTARTNLPLSTLKPNDILDIPAGTSIDQANGMNVAIPTTAIPAGPNTDHLFLFVASTASSNKTVTIKAGVGGGAVAGAAFRAGLGDVTVTAKASTGGGIIGPFESARFLQTDASVNIDFQSGLTGTITAFIMPSRW